MKFRTLQQKASTSRLPKWVVGLLVALLWAGSISSAWAVSQTFSISLSLSRGVSLQMRKVQNPQEVSEQLAQFDPTSVYAEQMQLNIGEESLPVVRVTQSRVEVSSENNDAVQVVTFALPTANDPNALVLGGYIPRPSQPNSGTYFGSVTVQVLFQ